MHSKDIRKKFINYFKKQNHEHVASSSLIPAQDPTLLFANAGMNQFKDLFLGNEKRKYTTAITIQKCVRAGGKHNDLDNIGFTKRHLTFFEMMGNFSFGNYFKNKAIRFAWDCLTKEIGLCAKDLHITVYKDDDDSYNIWHNEIGIPKERLHRLDADENFWQMGDTGPCGPCTEIYIDRGPTFGNETAPGGEGDRFLELWNLVFMQYDRQPNGIDIPLKQVGVDTGMGIERIASVMQDVDSVYETDLFMPIIKKIETFTNTSYKNATPEIKAAFQVLADHIRSSSLLIADGCSPSNDGRGYVLRKIIRRAALFAQKLSSQSIFPELSGAFIEIMGDVYPELAESKLLIKQVLAAEIDKFSANLVRGQAILDKYFKKNKDTKVISGSQVFNLYDTYGFPTELIDILAKEANFKVDHKEFKKEMEKQKEQSRKKVVDDLSHINNYDTTLSTQFTGYDELETNSKITALIQDSTSVNKVKAGTNCWVVVEKSPFFIVGGGQVPDTGWLRFGKHQIKHQQVRYINKAIAVNITAPIDLSVGESATSIVHADRRSNAMKNHTGTHLLQAALIELFGNQIKQSGSLVDPDYLRFDFTYHRNLTDEDIKNVEDLVNEKIRENLPINIHYTSYKEAINRGVLAFFGEKYNPENVRIVDIPSFSQELCGGTHVPTTGAIGAFKITDMSSPAAGLRRIFAVTGPQAIVLYQESFNTVKKLGQEFKIKRENVFDTVLRLKESNKALQIDLKKTRKMLWQSHIKSWDQDCLLFDEIPFLFKKTTGFSTTELKEIAETLSHKKPGIYCLFNTEKAKVSFVIMVSSEYAEKINLKKLSAFLKEESGLRGGGSKNSLQGSGTALDPELKEKIIQFIISQ